jgi:hypothetical protein
MTKTKSAKSPAAKPHSKPAPADPHARIRAACLAIPADKIRPINVDVPSACSVMLGASDALKAQLDSIVAVIPSFERAQVEQLAERAEFAHYAYSACLGVADDKTAQEELAKGNALRKQLQDWAESCVKLGFASGIDLKEIERIPYGYRDTPHALNALHAFFIERRESIEGNVKLPWSEIDSARSVAARISTLAGSTGKPDASAPNWDLAQRAFTLVADAYDECRAALAYVRRHQGDANTIAPGYANRSTGKSPRKGSNDSERDDSGTEKNSDADKPHVLRDAEPPSAHE